MYVFVRGADERDHKVARQLLTVLTVRVPCSTMLNAQLEIAEEMKQRYDQIADKLNAARSKSGQEPITGSTVMQVVLARFAGLPMGEDVDLSSVSSPPQGGAQADLMISTRPNPGASEHADFMASTRPHGG